MNRAWRWILPCYLFTLPTTLVGLALGRLFYGAHSWEWRDGVLTSIGTSIWGRPMGQTLGWVQFYDEPSSREYPDLRVHENAHVVQAFACSLVGLALLPLLFMTAGWSPLLGLLWGGFLGGVGFSVLYGILFVYLLLKQRSGWFSAYWANPFEVQARKVQDEYLADTSKRPWGA